MFGISFDELIIIFIISIILCRPADLKKISKFYKNVVKFVTNLKRGVEKNFVDIHNKVISYDDEADVKPDTFKEVHKTSYVLDDEGKMHPSFDISEFKNKEAKRKK